MNTPGTPKEPERKLGWKPWGEVTDPREHNPDRFRYLVHAISPGSRSTVVLMGMLELKTDPHSIAVDEGDQSTNLFLHPERVAQRVALSCSLIDQHHHGTWDVRDSLSKLRQQM